ncbi:hypothetical protein KKA69_06000 [Patescibacteria group bacterium]|nr:hypothetical protein [Patescibacteria group bacterium]
MYLRRHSKKVDGENYDYWSLVESVRTLRGPRQRIVATIGKLPGQDREERIGWEDIGRILDGKPRPEAELFEAYEEPPLWANVNINQVSVEIRGGIFCTSFVEQAWLCGVLQRAFTCWTGRYIKSSCEPLFLDT